MRLINADAIWTGEMWKNRRFIEAIDDAPTIQTKEVKYFDEDDKAWKIGSVIVDE